MKMSRIKQSFRTRAKNHVKHVLKNRKRRSRLKAKRRSARSRPHRRQGSKR